MAGGGGKKPPWWAVLTLAAGLVALAVLLPFDLRRQQIGASEGAAAAPAEPPIHADRGPAPLAVVLGDSWSEGSGAEYPGGGFADQLAEAQGWRLINASQGGTGYVTDGPENYPKRAPLPERVPDVVAQGPDVVMVVAGLNDAGRDYTTEQLEGAVEATLRPLRDQLPEALVVVIGPFWPNEEPIDSALQVDAVIRQEAEDLGLPFVSPIEERWITGTNDGTPLGNRAQYIGTGVDGTHPTQAGHDYLADRIEQFLTTVPDVPSSS
ncbi:SGNH/GDSL hydrolase family protein [Geodermatophilus sp. SYSU D00758]